jgi:diaminobutyrate-2-oxoglutarate transaminase
MKIFDEIESEVQSYARNFPRMFDKAEGEFIYDEDGNQYVDFLAGAGSLNYGHYHPKLKEKLLDYVERGGISHSLDLHTVAKKNFWKPFRKKSLNRVILIIWLCLPVPLEPIRWKLR